MRNALGLAAVIMFSLSSLNAAELPLELQARAIRLILKSSGVGDKILCKDGALAAELAKQGVTADGGAKVAWANSEAEVKSLKNSGHLVLCGKLEWLPAGGSLAVVEENGHPAIYMHMSNIANSGVTLGDALLKIGKKM